MTSNCDWVWVNKANIFYCRVNVTIDGVACVISSNDGSTIECRTDAHQGSIEADVKVKLGSDGFAVVPEVLFLTCLSWLADKLNLLNV